MGKSTKTQRIRERMQADVKHSKQTLLGQPNLPVKEPSKATLVEPKIQKLIQVTEVDASTREDELALKIGFKLLPSRTAFSRVTADLYFDGEKVESLRLKILQGPLAMGDSEFVSVLDMTGIGEGQHTLRVEMYERWSSEEKFTATVKEVSVNYVPVRREDRLIRVPIVKRSAGTDLAIASDSENRIYRELEEDMKKETSSQRDSW